MTAWFKNSHKVSLVHIHKIDNLPTVGNGILNGLDLSFLTM